MQNDAIWQAFAETGDPFCYLLYKACQEEKREKDRKQPAGDKPQAQA